MCLLGVSGPVGKSDLGLLWVEFGCKRREITGGRAHIEGGNQRRLRRTAAAAGPPIPPIPRRAAWGVHRATVESTKVTLNTVNR